MIQHATGPSGWCSCQRLTPLRPHAELRTSQPNTRPTHLLHHAVAKRAADRQHAAHAPRACPHHRAAGTCRRGCRARRVGCFSKEAGGRAAGGCTWCGSCFEAGRRHTAAHPPSMRPRSSARLGLWSFDSACAVRFIEITALQAGTGSRRNGLERGDDNRKIEYQQ